MARPLRIEFDGATYLIIGRAEKHRHVYRDDEDREKFLATLAAQIHRYGWKCYAYSLLDNGYQLVIETPKGGLTRGMRQLNGVYTQYYNRKYNNSGNVFQGRYKSILIQKESFLLPVCRYVNLSPKLQLKEPIHRYKWSSYRATAGVIKAPDFLDVTSILSRFGKQPKKAKEKFRQYVKEGEREESPLLSVRHQILLGDDAFVKKMRPCLSNYRSAKRLAATGRKKIKQPSLAQIFKGVGKLDRDARNALIRKAHLEYGYTLSAISAKTGLHFTTISKIVNAG
ncbi:MAG: addiction module toxin RelE [Gammaproteobacteria bacterium]|nr:MAG: addiction module toxin RelE [Gammaproteobacteria bacterium]